ncbi:DUF2525 domain-containing protein [Pantoea sp. LMR881]|uniref:DUF2525 domain-containing protein n=1 Tax=Pantoea sp. LMR881 TaxID=3014336 RepID=UPI0022AF49EA|nr:DUF2525 domain-containing protein [Pantoea sp. LMR881]MCZ4058115.1 DUF2525 domain-containing protein [Pantoea sp. LMR881]
MASPNKYSDDVQQEMQVNVEALLEAIQAKTSGDVREYMETEHAYRVAVDGQHFESYSELAEAFELDIRDYTSCEVNR